MPSANYVLLEKITVGAAGASSVTFSSIPQTGYTDLVVKYTARSTYTTFPSDAIDVRLTFNGSSSGYSERMLYGTGSAAASAATSGSFLNWAGTQTNTAQTASTFASSEIYIPNYTSSNNKSMSIDAVQENNATASAARLVASLWANSAAITSLTLSPDYGNFAQYSTFYLYGVAKLGTTPAIVPYATGGDTIMTDGTYWYHAFTSSGTFTPAKSLTCDYLVVAGGGGSSQGAGASGGGGAGGLRSTVTATGGGGSLESALSLGAQAYTVTIGAGGAGGAPTGGNGSNSTFATITSTGGGRSGGPNPNQNGVSGGSGGGGGEQSGIYGTGGAGTANQGYAGGAAGSAVYRMGGGGGAGAAGVAGGSSSGNGGAGVAVSITGSSVTYAGGGGGAAASSAGTGGSGGGGNGGNSGAGVAGTANTGGGGGGSYVALGAAGGSGIVIVRYAV
jgi:hypothetical protein